MQFLENVKSKAIQTIHKLLKVLGGSAFSEVINGSFKGIAGGATLGGTICGPPCALIGGLWGFGIGTGAGVYDAKK